MLAALRGVVPVVAPLVVMTVVVLRDGLPVVVARVDELRRRRDGGAPLGAHKPTLGACLGYWMPLHRSRVRPVTADRDEKTRRLYFGPIESVRIDRLRFQDIDRWLVGVADRGLSPRTQQMCRTLLGTALQEAVRQSVVVRNEQTPSAPVRMSAPDVKYLTAKQIRQLLDAARGIGSVPASLS